MCGIVGVVAKSPSGLYSDQADIFEELLYADGVRGMDSTGVFQVSYKNKVNVLKQAANPGVFCATDSFQRFKKELPKSARLVIGHNRKATWGDITSKNAHPFDADGIVLVHNGYIANHNELDKDVEVDSQSIITALNKAENPVDAIGKLFGAWAIVWYNHGKKKLYMARNHERPLAIIHTDQFLYLASEAKMLEWVLSRNVKWQRSFNSIELETNKVYEISLDPFSIDKHDVVPRVVVTAPSKPTQAYWPSTEVYHEGGMGETATCEFELEAKVEPLTEAGRAAARIKAEEAFKDAVETRVQQVRKLYPHNTYVLFKQDTMLPGDGYITLIGKAWQPGKEAVKTQAVIMNSDKNEAWVECGNTGIPMLARVMAISRKNDDIRLLVEDVRAPSGTVKDIVGKVFSHEEWSMISHFIACSSCAKPVEKATIDFVKIKVNDSKEYEVTCQNCMNEQTCSYNGC